MKKKQLIKSIIVCPNCHERLNLNLKTGKCKKCGLNYFFNKDTLILHDKKLIKGKFQLIEEDNITKTDKLFNLGKKFINSDYTPKDYLGDLLKQTKKGDAIINIGSGNKNLRNDIINVDIFSFKNVDIVADVEKMPFKNNSVDLLIVENVLEHIPRPQECINEAYRVLKPGGKIIAKVPFIHIYHDYPKHYFNFSKDGLEYIFANFSKVDIKMNNGPTCALNDLISEYGALAFSGKSKLFYIIFKGLFLIPIFLFKYLDYFWFYSKKSLNIANTLCVLAVKKKN